MAHIAAADGTPIYYVDQGSGPVLVLLQGLMLTADGFWGSNLAPLAARCRVIAIDHRSHGQSGKPLGRHTIRQCAEDLKHVLDGLDLADVTLAGVAFGAMVMLEYRRHFGNHRLARLAIVEAQVKLTNATGWDHPTFGDFPPEAAAGFVEACHHSREPLTGFLLGAFGTPPPDEDMARMQAQAWLTPTQAAIDYVEDMIAADYREDLPGIDLPTLLIYGRMNNVPIPSELGQWIAGQIPGARLDRFSDAGHSPFHEQPERFNALISDFAHG
ncbi:alpha/beta fold hydrolase [Blastomonas fulva]|uniref:alpha/beta fold hydrolase n=1 Tax=Blastomonas fulva TaxID=1550728 RepID=UPI003F7089E2